jgi:hypothetical protein
MDNPAPSSVINLKSLRWSLTLLLAAALLTAAAVTAALQFGRQTELAEKRARALQGETRAKLARVHEDEREIRAKIVRYQELVGTGRIAPERRLEWVETLRQIKESRKLLGLDYEIAPQRPLDEKAVDAGGYAFLASPMKLEMPLLHENDLLGLIADLKAQVPAIVSPRHCLIERATAGGRQPLAATLKAQCEIDWISLQETVVPEKSPPAGGKK